MALMLIGVLCFEIMPASLMGTFSKDSEVIRIGAYALRVIAFSFVPMVTSLIFPVFFQAIGLAFKSSALTVLRTVVLFVPLGWVLAHFGLDAFWFTFPITEVITTTVGFIMYKKSGFGKRLVRREQ